MNFLFLFEPSSVEAFLDGRDKPNYSHDLNLMQLAQGALLNDANVFIASYSDQDYLYISNQYWPLTQLQPAHSVSIKFDFVISANHLAFKNRKRGFSKNVLVQAAVHSIESPQMYFPAGIATYINVVQNAIDFQITQNSRMKDLIHTMNQLLSGFNDANRILISQLSPRVNQKKYTEFEKNTLRERFNIPKDAKVIINAGGAWKWTQFNEFLLAFNKCFEINLNCSLFFIQPALSQKQNSEHDRYHIETKQILNSLPLSVRSRIYIGDNWQLTSKKLDEFLSISDYGLNLNLDSLEQWQSFRVRTIEYLSFDLPLISSKGTFWDLNDHENAFVFTGFTVDEISQSLLQICDENNDNYQRRVNDVIKIKNELSIENQARKVIERLINHELLHKKIEISSVAIWDYAKFGPSPKVSIARYSNYFYNLMTQNAFVHRILVSVGIRAIYRKLRNLKDRFFLK